MNSYAWVTINTDSSLTWKIGYPRKFPINWILFLIDSKVLMVDLPLDLLFSIALRSRLWVDVPCSLDRVQSSWLKEIHTTLRIVLLELKVPKGFSDLRESWQNLFVWHHVQLSVMIPRILWWSPVTYSRLGLSGSTELVLVTFKWWCSRTISRNYIYGDWC